MRLVQAMYSQARCQVRVGDSYCEEFDVTVGVHQGSVLSALNFIMILEALSRDLRVSVLWELFFADDLVYHLSLIIYPFGANARKGKSSIAFKIPLNYVLGTSRVMNKYC